MGLSQPRQVFGVHSVSPYSRVTGEFYGIIKVLEGSTIALTGDLVKSTGGSNRFPWAVEEGLLSAEISLKVKEYPDFLFELLLGVAPTAGSAEASGNCSTLTNKKGSSTMHATTGIASAAVKASAKADLKFGKYVVKVVSATTVDVYASTDVDFSRGTDKTYESDLLKITASALTIVAATATEIPGFGIELTGGSGTIGMTTGDTATFEVRPINTKSSSVIIGANADEFPEFGAIVMAAKRGNGEMFELDCYRCKGIGLPIALQANAFSEAEIKMEAFYDSTLNGVFKMRHVTPETAS
jgi:hypothetical protein